MKKIHVLTLSWEGYSKLDNLRPGLSLNLTHATMANGILKDGWDYSEWYIRDNGSKDGTIDKIESWKYDSSTNLITSVYPVSHNRDNFSQCVNFLFDKAAPRDDDLILLLNNDIEFNDHESLSNMIKLMTPDVGVVGARLLYPDTNKLQHAGVIFSERYGRMPYHYKHGETNDIESCKNRYFQAVTGACCLIRASDFIAAGGMNINYFWAFEDIDISLKIGKNKKIAYCGETNITHGESKTLQINPVNKMFLSHNVKFFKNTWFGKYEIDHDKYLNNKNYNEIL